MCHQFPICKVLAEKRPVWTSTSAPALTWFIFDGPVSFWAWISKCFLHLCCNPTAKNSLTHWQLLSVLLEALPGFSNLEADQLDYLLPRLHLLVRYSTQSHSSPAIRFNELFLRCILKAPFPDLCHARCSPPFGLNVTVTLFLPFIHSVSPPRTAADWVLCNVPFYMSKQRKAAISEINQLLVLALTFVRV